MGRYVASTIAAAGLLTMGVCRYLIALVQALPPPCSPSGWHCAGSRRETEFSVRVRHSVERVKAKDRL